MSEIADSFVSSSSCGSPPPLTPLILSPKHEITYYPKNPQHEIYNYLNPQPSCSNISNFSENSENSHGIYKQIESYEMEFKNPVNAYFKVPDPYVFARPYDVKQKSSKIPKKVKKVPKKEKKDEEVSSSIPDGLEFDGTQVLCLVCGDKASGFHYGVYSCEGCKGFFRRSIQQKIQYRPCTKNQQCEIQRVNRNRCQYCRLKKCIAVGMSSNAIRFGRVPKREKARLMAAMQSVASRSVHQQALSSLDDSITVIEAIVEAYMSTCDFTSQKVQELREQASKLPVYRHDDASSTCPLFPAMDSMFSPSSFRARFAKPIQGVLNFARSLPSFNQIPKEDCSLLLQSGTFEALLVSLAGLYCSKTNTFLCMNGRLMWRETVYSPNNSRFLMDSMCDFADRLNKLELSDAELALFTAVVIVAPDRPGLRYKDLIEKLHARFSTFLQTTLAQNHPGKPNLYQDLCSFINDIRTLNTLHSDKFYGKKKIESNHSDESYDDLEGHSPTSSYTPEEDARSVSYSDSISPEGSVCGNEVSTYMELQQSFANRRITSVKRECLSDDMEATALPALTKCPFKRRVMDHSDDSGVESDKNSLSSMCSSPPFFEEKNEDEREEDMPVLRRALQAPPIMNTDLIIEEAYKPHKKFRALRREEEPHSSMPSPPRTSILAQTLCQPLHHDYSLMSSAPSLTKRLLEQPKMSEDNLQRAEYLHNIIVKKEMVARGSRNSPNQYYAPRERLQSSVPMWSEEMCQRTVPSPVREPITTQPRLHLMTSSSPSRYYEPRMSTTTSPTIPSPPIVSPRNMSPPSQTSFSIQVDISNAEPQPLNLSKKTPPPTPSNFMIEV